MGARPKASTTDEVAERQIERLRERLLDLSNRNRLVNFRHPERSRTQLRVVDELPAELYKGLLGGRTYRFRAVPDPREGTTAPRLPIVEAARAAGIDPSLDLRPRSKEVAAKHVDSVIQVLHYPPETGRRLEGMRQEHLTSLQELGVPALYAVLGFLEWYESTTSTTPLLSPLVLLPLDIERLRERGAYQQRVTCAAEEPEPNRTLAFRLRRDVGLELPGLEALTESGDLDAHFSTVEQAIAGMARWRVRRFVTLSILSFARQVMYEDLAPARWQSTGGRLASPAVRALMIDGALPPRSPKAVPAGHEPLLVTAADSTQVAAINDVLDGRHLVIKGPPGTGKSQTITNLIAAAIGQGKRVLFVAEKMAALEVVKKRLDDAGIGRFCLALHSTKAKKRDVLEALHAAKEARGPRRGLGRVENIMAALHKAYADIDGYLATMNEPVGLLGRSLREVVWRELELREGLGAKAAVLATVHAAGASRLELHELEDVRARLTAVEQAVAGLGDRIATSPWRFIQGWAPHMRAEVVVEGVRRWRAALGSLDEPLRAIGGSPSDLTLGRLREVARQLGELALIDATVPGDLIERLRVPGLAGKVAELADKLDGRQRLLAATRVVCDPERVRRRVPEIAALARAIHDVGEWVRSQTLKSLRAWLGPQQAWARGLTQAVERARELARTLGFPGQLDEAGLHLVLELAEVAATASPDVLDNRKPAWTAISAWLERAATELARLRGQAAALDTQFSGWREESPPTLRGHVVVLRTSGWLSRTFGGAFRKARQAYLVLASGRTATAEEMASSLQQLADHLEQVQRFLASVDFRDAIGPAYRGLESDLELPLRVHAWAAAVRAAIAGNDARSTWARGVMFTADASRLRDLVAFVQGEGQPLDQLARKSRGDLLTKIAAEQAIAQAIGERLARVDDAGLNELITIDELSELLTNLGALAGVERELPADADGRMLLGDHWRGVETRAELLRRAVVAWAVLDEIGLPEPIARWLRTDYRARLSQAGEVSVALEACLADEEQLRARMRADGHVFGEIAGPEASLEQIRARVDEALADLDGLPPWLHYIQARRGCDEHADADRYLQTLEGASDLTVATWTGLADGFEWCVLRALEHAGLATRSESERRRWTPEVLEASRRHISARLAELEGESRQVLAGLAAAKPVPRGRATGPRSEWTDEALLGHELGKQKRHLPVRQLVARAGEAIFALTPCLMMSPLSIAQYLESPDLRFDLLVIDEASQLPPEDALGALLRATQVVVVGDEQQLPPTDFFRRLEEDDDDRDEDEDLEAESILDLGLRALGGARVLQWHYRSRHPSLIDFANSQFYGGGLVVPPSPADGEMLGVHLDHVAGEYGASLNPKEADAVVARVIALMQKAPERSLGVVAVNQQQADLIRERIDERLREAELDYVERWKNTLEPFFVKNLENVQGDERDTIVVSMTYGPNQQGRVLQYFGPIAGANGHRRLNVLFSRAKFHLVIVTSLRPTDITLGPGARRGVQVLRDYLIYAGEIARRRSATGALVGQGPSYLAAQTLALGYDVAVPGGSGPMEIDLGVRHPKRRDSFVAGLELDGGDARGGSRDRFGVRPAVLAQLGWGLVSTWTIEWLHEPAVARHRMAVTLGETCRASKLAPPALKAAAVVRDVRPKGDVVVPDGPPPGPVQVELSARGRILASVEIVGHRIVIGRGRSCQVRVPDEFDDVAALQCELTWDGARYWLADLGSHHGTYVRGKRIARDHLAPDAPHMVRLGLGVVAARVAFGARTAVAVATPSVSTVGAATGMTAHLGGAWFSALAPEEQRLLELLAQNRTMRQSDLAAALGRVPGRVPGLARQLRHKLHEHGRLLFNSETLPSGEMQFVFVSPEEA